MASALRVIGHLKRLGSHTDAELRVVFLQCRTTFLSENLNQIPTANAYVFVRCSCTTFRSLLLWTLPLQLSKFIEATRSQIFDIITQYRAIFSVSMDDASSHADEENGADRASREEDDGGVMFGWVVQRLTDFLGKLEKALGELTDGSSLGNILNQCMYFGLSLGRLGLDFRSLLLPIFEKAIFGLYKHNIIQAHSQFSSQLKKYKLFPIQQTMLSSSSLPSTPNSSSSSAPFATPSPGVAKPTDTLSPPLSLLDFPPAAALCNGVLTALNELRKCCPTSLQFSVTRHFESIMTTIIQQLRVFARETPLTAQEKIAVQELSRVLCDDLIPFLVKCFDVLFRSSHRLISQEKLQTMMADLFERRAVQSTVAELLKSVPDAPPSSQQVQPPVPELGAATSAVAGDGSSPASVVSSASSTPVPSAPGTPAPPHISTPEPLTPV